MILGFPRFIEFKYGFYYLMKKSSFPSSTLIMFTLNDCIIPQISEHSFIFLSSIPDDTFVSVLFWYKKQFTAFLYAFNLPWHITISLSIINYLNTLFTARVMAEVVTTDLVFLPYYFSIKEIVFDPDAGRSKNFWLQSLRSGCHFSCCPSLFLDQSFVECMRCHYLHRVQTYNHSVHFVLCQFGYHRHCHKTFADCNSGWISNFIKITFKEVWLLDIIFHKVNISFFFNYMINPFIES